MSCLRNYLRTALSRQLRSKPAVRPQPRPPQEAAHRHYHPPSRRLEQVLQSSNRGGLFRRDTIVCNRPPPAQAALRRHYKRLTDLVRFTPRRDGGGPEWYQDKRVVKAAYYVSGCAVVTLCCGKFETVPYSNRTHFIVLPPSAERFLGKCFFARSRTDLSSKILPPEHPDSVRVRKLTMEIVRAAERGLAGPPQAELSDEERRKGARARGHRRGISHLDGLDWEVIVVKDKLVNAMCLPGGKIIVYTGLLDQMKMDAEVATVLGHEVGHAIARHVAENITKLLWFVILKIVFLQFIDIGEGQVWIDRMWRVLFQLPFSRRMEIEADHIGIMLLAAAGFDPQIAPKVFEKLGKITGDSELKNYISTHPSSKKRSQLLSQDKVMQEAMELYRKAKADKETKGFFSFIFKG